MTASDSDEKDSTKLHHFQLLDSLGRVLGRRHQALLWKHGETVGDAAQGRPHARGGGSAWTEREHSSVFMGRTWELGKIADGRQCRSLGQT